MALRKKTTAIPENNPIMIASNRKRLPSERVKVRVPAVSHLRPKALGPRKKRSSSAAGAGILPAHAFRSLRAAIPAIAYIAIRYSEARWSLFKDNSAEEGNAWI